MTLDSPGNQKILPQIPAASFERNHLLIVAGWHSFVFAFVGMLSIALKFVDANLWMNRVLLTF